MVLTPSSSLGAAAAVAASVVERDETQKVRACGEGRRRSGHGKDAKNAKAFILADLGFWPCFISTVNLVHPTMEMEMRLLGLGPWVEQR
jgi:hypothetical protein